MDVLQYNLGVKLKSKSRSPHTFAFHHDAFRSIFYNKGTASNDGKARMLQKEDFHHLNLPCTWYQSVDKNGDGVTIHFPIRMQLHLSWSPKLAGIQQGKLVNWPQMPLEKLSIQFVTQPFAPV